MNNFNELKKVMNKLRAPGGCPWDREQTIKSLKPYLLEETYELLDAMDGDDSEELKSELGDLLLQVVFQSEIMEEKGKFSVYDVIDGIKDKLIRRHPHIFGDIKVNDSDDVMKNWEEIKLKEKIHINRKSLMDGIPNALPALSKAVKIQNKAKKIGFDFISYEEVFDKIEEEIKELKVEIVDKKRENMEQELGDLLFSIVNLGRALKINPEDALTHSNKKFIHRFKEMEKLENLKEIGRDEMEKLWNKVKKEIK